MNQTMQQRDPKDAGELREDIAESIDALCALLGWTVWRVICQAATDVRNLRSQREERPPEAKEKGLPPTTKDEAVRLCGGIRPRHYG